MTVIEAAELEGFELCWRRVGGKLCVGFVHGDDLRYPGFGEEHSRSPRWPIGSGVDGVSA